MYWTHHFAHHETLSRARSWLTQLGYSPDRIEVHADGVPRLALTVNRQELAEVQMLINAVERADPQGWPSFWDLARQDYLRPETEGEVPPVVEERSKETIGWHPPD
ncbi:MAG: hypothetical protein P4L84_13760 [Isosphaeraceae bacterium]|nr:hypothetical protein [Isosphaeraceae bacterium]